jgi:hypothetical protein
MFVTRVQGFVHSGFGFPQAPGEWKSESRVYETSNPCDKHAGELFSGMSCVPRDTVRIQGVTRVWIFLNAAGREIQRGKTV